MAYVAVVNQQGLGALHNHLANALPNLMALWFHQVVLGTSGR